jgi:hypothetical protein
MAVDEAAADEGLEESWDAHRVTVDVEHLANVEVDQHFLMVKDPDPEDAIVYVAEREHVTVEVLGNDITFDKATIDGHALHLFYLFHQL